MNEKLIKQCEFYIGNCEILKKNLKPENVYLIHTCAGLFASKRNIIYSDIGGVANFCDTAF